MGPTVIGVRVVLGAMGACVVCVWCDDHVVSLFFRGGSRPKNPRRIRDGSTIRIRPGLVFLFPAIVNSMYVLFAFAVVAY